MSTDDDKPDDDNALATTRPKLVEAKERWARDGRLLTGHHASHQERLPPGQHLVRDWPVLDLGITPKIEIERWRFTVGGLVETRLDWRWDEFMAQPQLNDVSDIHCVTAWSRYDNRWEGVAAKHIIKLARPKPEARFVVFHGYDDYATNLPLSYFDDDDVLIAHSWDGQPLTREHGGPARAIVPKLYFWKSAKWIKRMEFIAEDRAGFWEERGYHDRGDPWIEERYS